MAFDDPNPETTIRSMILLGEMGDLEITWEPENDEQVRAIIEKKMKAGMNFFILKPIVGDLLPMRRKLTKMDDLKTFNVKIKDADIEGLFTAGEVALVRSNGQIDGRGGRAKTSHDVVRNRTVGIPALGGG